MNKSTSTVSFVLTILLTLTLIPAFGQSEENKQDSLLLPDLDIIVCGPGVPIENSQTFYNSHFIEDAEICSEDISANHNPDLTRIMQSKTAGLLVSANSFSPGASSKIIMRGYRSILGNNQPLILINGMPIDNSEWNNSSGGTDQSNRLLDIDPHMIESIDVIKSMAGRAKYGIVGGNGVINIKTKVGYQSKPSITFKSSIGIDELSIAPYLQSTYAQGRVNNETATYRGPSSGEANSWGPAIADLTFDGNSNYEFDKNGQLGIINNGTPAIAYDPYQFFENGSNRNLSLNLTGGTKKLSYFAAASTNNQLGIIPTTNYNRHNISTVLNYDVSNKLSLQLNGIFSSSNTQRNQKGATLSSIMLGLLRSSPTFDNSNGLEDPVNNPDSYTLADGTQRSYRNGIYDNPYWSLNKSKHNDKVTRQLIKLSAQYELKSNIDLLLNVGTESYKDTRLGGKDIDTSPFLQYEGSAYNRALNFDAQSVDFAVRHQNKTTSLFEIESTLGFNYYQNEYAFQRTEAFRLLLPDNVTTTNAEEIEVFNSSNQLKRMGGILAVDVNYSDFLNVTGSIRQDYSNKFGADTNGFLSYGLGAAFSLASILNFTEQKSYDVQILTSIGQFGNEYSNIPPQQYISSNIGGDPFISGAQLGQLEVNRLSASNFLNAEKVNAFDVGLNFSMQKADINLNITYYNEQSSDVILIEPISPSSGVSDIYKNIAEISNTGIDVSFSAKPVYRNKFSWITSIDFNKNTNLIKASTNSNQDVILLSGFTNTSSVVIEDHPMGVIYGRGFLRNEDNQIVIGDDGFPSIDPTQKILGDPNPDWTMYINNTFKIGKSFILSAAVDIRQGGEMWCGTCGSLDYFGRTQLAADERETSVIFDGVREDGSTNTLEAQLAPDNGNFNDFYRVRYGFGGITEMSIYDTSWIRLRNISVSYNLANLINKPLVKNLTIGLYAENLFLLTEYPGIDPETNLTGNSNGFGIDYYNNPGTKRYGLSLQATF